MPARSRYMPQFTAQSYPQPMAETFDNNDRSGWWGVLFMLLMLLLYFLR